VITNHVNVIKFTQMIDQVPNNYHWGISVIRKDYLINLIWLLISVSLFLSAITLRGNIVYSILMLSNRRYYMGAHYPLPSTLFFQTEGDLWLDYFISFHFPPGFKKDLLAYSLLHRGLDEFCFICLHEENQPKKDRKEFNPHFHYISWFWNLANF
jgi:hypothetical protein